MVHMPWYDIFLLSIPEGLVFFSFGLALIDYKIKENIKLIFISVFIYSLLSYTLQVINTPDGIRTLIQIAFCIFLTKYILKLNLKTSFLVIFSGVTILAIFEALNLTLVTQIANITYEEILKSPILFTLIPYTHFIIIGLITTYLSKRHINLLPLLSKLKAKIFKQNLLLILTILFLFFLLTLVYSLSLFINKGFFEYDNGIRISYVLFFLLIIIIVFTIKRLINATETQAIIETQEVYLKNMQELYTGLRSQRHDFTNQIQVIHGLLGLNKIEAAKEFSTELCQHLANLNKVVEVDDPVLAALLQAKMSFADKNQVNFTLDVKTKLDKLSVTPLEFTKITGNLLDNAFDAAMQLPEENRRVGFALRFVDNYYLIVVTNTGHPIPPNMLKQIFTGGVTTKKEHTGLGLSIVKKLVEKYKGDIKVSSDESGTVFTVTLPIK